MFGGYDYEVLEDYSMGMFIFKVVVDVVDVGWFMLDVDMVMVKVC